MRSTSHSVVTSRMVTKNILIWYSVPDDTILDCYTVPAWWPQDCQWVMRHGRYCPFVIGWSKYSLGNASVTMYSGLTRLVGFSTVLQRPLTVPLNCPNGRQMPAIRAVQGDCETEHFHFSYGRKKKLLLGWCHEMEQLSTASTALCVGNNRHWWILLTKGQ